jgi:murein DD-endopeptidase MepM/ murein hydrolase activator NlpD
VSIERIGDLVQRARAEAAAQSEAQPGSERDRLMRVAQEFESMLMLQMLREMRKAGSWADEEERTGGLGAETMFDTIDVELAGHLARVQGLGLGKQLLDALKKMHPEDGGSTKQDPPHALPTVGGSIQQGPLDQSPANIAPPDELPADVGRALNFGPGNSSLEIPEGAVTSGFGWRRDPIHGAARFHRGIDIRAAYGQEVSSAANGRVVSAGTEGGYGQTVVVEHAGGVRTRYAHLSMTTVAAGDEVREGQLVGRAGHSGRATGTHLHFEVTTAGGDALNPEHFSKFKANRPAADFTRASNSVLQETRR